MRWIIIFCCSLVFTLTAWADEVPTVLVVVGAEGTPEYGSEFAKCADRWEDAAKRAPAHFILIGRDPSTSPSDKQRLHDALESELRNSTQPLWLVLIGHGTYDKTQAKFNLRGEDVSDVELAQWLKPCTRPLAVIDCSSSSATFLNRLSGPGRVIVTATRSGQEESYARFGEYFSAAITDQTADLDKDGQVSILEAFIAASHRVEEFYKGEGRLASEHALLDDNGDGLGVSADWFQGTRASRAAKDGAPIDGVRANQWHLILSPAEQAIPAELRARRDELEIKIETLRSRKNALTEADYYRQLDALLLTLARVYQQAENSGKVNP